MKLVAPVRRVTGKTAHYVGFLETDRISALPVAPPESLRIEGEPGNFFLLRLDESGKCLADTWHQTLEGAKSQALSEYETRDEDWTRVDS